MVQASNAPYEGTGPKKAKYAHGGCEITTKSCFYKSPDPFKHDIEITDYKKKGKAARCPS
jgi:hypothetical protein